MSRATLARCCCLCVCLVALVFGTRAQAQIATASCTFKLFQLNASDPTNPVISVVSGTNKWGTVVGSASPSGKNSYYEGFIRYANGSVKYFLPSGSIRTFLNARNDAGEIVGYWEDGAEVDHGFLMQGSTTTAIVDPSASTSFNRATRPTGINKWNTIVGQFLPDNGMWTGFKRYSNGSFASLMYPKAMGTYPAGVNDAGMVVGTYYDANAMGHGFAYYKGQWASIDYPLGGGTGVLGIDNAGVILGASQGGWGYFLYANSAFRNLPGVPNSSSTDYDGMSAAGVLTGRATLNSSVHGFTASCQ